jgi:hypothetical protein
MFLPLCHRWPIRCARCGHKGDISAAVAELAVKTLAPPAAIDRDLKRRPSCARLARRTDGAPQFVRASGSERWPFFTTNPFTAACQPLRPAIHPRSTSGTSDSAAGCTAAFARTVASASYIARFAFVVITIEAGATVSTSAVGHVPRLAFVVITIEAGATVSTSAVGHVPRLAFAMVTIEAGTAVATASVGPIPAATKSTRPNAASPSARRGQQADG